MREIVKENTAFKRAISFAEVEYRPSGRRQPVGTKGDGVLTKAMPWGSSDTQVAAEKRLSVDTEGTPSPDDKEGHAARGDKTVTRSMRETGKESTAFKRQIRFAEVKHRPSSRHQPILAKAMPWGSSDTLVAEEKRLSVDPASTLAPDDKEKSWV